MKFYNIEEIAELYKIEHSYLLDFVNSIYGGVWVLFTADAVDSFVEHFMFSTEQKGKTETKEKKEKANSKTDKNKNKQQQSK